MISPAPAFRLFRRALSAVLPAALLFGSTAFGAASTAPWQTLPSLPAAGTGLTAVRLPDDSIVAVGGAATQRSGARMAVRLDPKHDAWQSLPPAPVDLDTPAALALTDHAVLIVAPSFANGSIGAPSKALILDPIWRRWITLPPCPVALLNPRVLLLNAHTVLAVGGVGDLIGATLNLTTEQWIPLRSPVPDLAGYSMAAMTGKGALLLSSVAIGAVGQPVAVRRAWLLSPFGVWTEAARPPLVVDGAQAVDLGNGQILFAGGYPLGDDPKLPAPPALLYNVSRNQWSVAGSTGTDHRGGQLVLLSTGRAVLVGGHGPDGSPTLSCIVFSTAHWRKAYTLPSPAAGYAAVATAHGELMVIGGTRPSAKGMAAGAAAMLLPLDTLVAN
jgi:large repetitive protein